MGRDPSTTTSAFNHISTAYVGGARLGLRTEELPAVDSPSNNAYERTKLQAEHLVMEADLPQVRMFRPGIVIGHSRTRAATAFTGLYGFVRNLRLLRTRVSEVLGDMLLHRPLRLIADGSVPINLIPIDLVAASAVQISQAEDQSRIFHLTNSSPPDLNSGLSAIAELVGIKPPRYVDSSDELTSIDGGLQGQLCLQAVDQILEFGTVQRQSRCVAFHNQLIEWHRSPCVSCLSKHRLRPPPHL